MSKNPRHTQIRFVALNAILIFVLISISCCSQTPRFKHYTSDEGFTGASFKTVAQDSMGFLWIATASGLYNFDGYRFTVYKANRNDSLSIPRENVTKMWIDHLGRIWLGFNDCILFYDRNIDGFIKHKPALLKEIPRAACFEGEQKVWL